MIANDLSAISYNSGNKNSLRGGRRRVPRCGSQSIVTSITITLTLPLPPFLVLLYPFFLYLFAGKMRSRTVEPTEKMRKPGPPILRFAVPLLLVCVVLEIACAFRVLHREAPFPGEKARLSRLAGIHFAIADFDGDWKPDLALVEATSLHRLQSDYAIHFLFSAGPELSVFVSAPTGGLRVAARDVNGDDLPDLVVSSALDERVVAILLNRGHGQFSEAEPASYVGIPADPNTFYRAGDQSIADKYTVLSMRYSFDGERVGRAANPHAVATDSVGMTDPLISAAAELHACHGRSPPPRQSQA
jgi:hypothetical protein